MALNGLSSVEHSMVSGTRRPPDPALQFGFMNYSLPNVAPMPTIGMPQLQLVQMIPLAPCNALVEHVMFVLSHLAHFGDVMRASVG